MAYLYRQLVFNKVQEAKSQNRGKNNKTPWSAPENKQ